MCKTLDGQAPSPLTGEGWDGGDGNHTNFACITATRAHGAPHPIIKKISCYSEQREKPAVAFAVFPAQAGIQQKQKYLSQNIFRRVRPRTKKMLIEKIMSPIDPQWCASTTYNAFDFSLWPRASVVKGFLKNDH